MDYGYVFDIKKFSLHDGPGIRTTVFLKGCPLVCPWCHNPESQSPDPEVFIRSERCLLCGRCIEVCPEDAISMDENGTVTDFSKCLHCGTCAYHCPADAREIVGTQMSVNELLEIIKRDRLFYDESGGGVTFSGGEPLAQSEFLIRLLKACAREEIHRAVDTTGLIEKSRLSQVAEETDLFLYDLKLIDPEDHRLHTGVDNQVILENLRWLSGQGFEMIVRIPVIPGVNDDESNVDALATFLLSLKNTPPINLLPFHQLAKSKHRKFGIPYRLDPNAELRPETFELFSNRLSGHGLNVSAGEYKP